MKPILFNTEMVRAILDSRKTQTRRVLTPQPIQDADGMWQWKDCQWMDGGLGFPISGMQDHAPYKPGDILWVRETWAKIQKGWGFHAYEEYAYKADNPDRDVGKWRPSIHMPKEAARLFLRVTDVRVERLQEISADNLKAEGLTSMAVHCGDIEIALPEWTLFWNRLNAKHGLDWYANPWVWVYTFEPVEKP